MGSIRSISSTCSRPLCSFDYPNRGLNSWKDNMAATLVARREHRFRARSQPGNRFQANLAEVRSTFLAVCRERSVPKPVSAIIARQFATAIQRGTELREIVVGDSIGPECVLALAAAIRLNFYTPIRRLSLWKCAIGDRAMIGLCQSIPNLHNLVTLEVVGSDITSSSCMALSSALTQTNSPRLASLNFDYNLIGTSGLRHLATALCRQASQGLRILNMGFCDLDNESGQIIASILTAPKCAIRAMNLEGNVLGDSGLCTISSGLAMNLAIESLNVSNNRIGYDSHHDHFSSFCQAIHQCRSLMSIDLSGNRITEQAALSIVNTVMESPHIKQLHLSPTLRPDLYHRVIDALQHNQRIRQWDRPQAKAEPERKNRRQMEERRNRLIQEFLDSQAQKRLWSA